jgi:hypothetical protein
MKRTYLTVMSLALAIPYAYVQQPFSGVAAQTSVVSQPNVDALPGRWVRVEGGYVISIASVDANGRLDANYANPRQLPFHSAMVTNDNGVLRLVFELRAAGYNGSTYTLSYDAASDQLKGVYDQVVLKQKFDVTFVRATPR